MLPLLGVASTEAPSAAIWHPAAQQHRQRQYHNNGDNRQGLIGRTPTALRQHTCQHRGPNRP